MDNDLLQRLLRTDCDLTRPIPPGAVFGTLGSEEDLRAAEGLAEMAYPPVSTRHEGCEFDPATRELRARVWGKAYLAEDGVYLAPTWNISEDRMLLTLEVDQLDCMGQEISVERLMEGMPKALAGLELDPQPLAEALEQARRTGSYVFVALLRGLFPEPGIDGHLDLLLREEQRVGTLREDGSMDYRERGGLHFVSPGDPLAELHPPLPGTPGFDIFGETVTPREPKEAKVRIGKNVVAAPGPEGVTVFSAAAKGVFHFRNNTLEVSELLEINGDVDLGTGNIRAQHGGVHVKGAVRSGCTVEAQGDVIVDGLIEEADITAGGLVVSGGVLMNGRNRIRAEGNVAAKFFQNAIVEAGGDVVAQLEISHCQITAGGDVTVLGPRGMIRGGHVVSGGNIVAQTLGNEARSATIVEIRPSNSEEKELIEQRGGLTEELERMDAALGDEDAIATLMAAPEEDRRILAELIKARGKLQGEVRALDVRILEQRQVLRERLAALHVRALRRVFSGVEVIIMGKRLSVTTDLEAARFRRDLDTRTIVME
ncbi:DUF342 domain-containing protein [Desulfocurvus vexinensis]|uniref:DUF342 domain-containing protein n=1 Tax=Desulfocurvus vexinensis TaxID=399548 RepID=UPI00048B69DD|nr:FapA family protein [Desulfocurvus vexinensis]